MKQKNLMGNEETRMLGELVENYMKKANLTTEWVRRTSHFGNSTFAKFKKATCNM